VIGDQLDSAVCAEAGEAESDGHLTSPGRGGNFLDAPTHRSSPLCPVHWHCVRRVTVGPSSRCDLRNSPRTFRDGQDNANTEPGKANVKTQFGSFSSDAKSNAGSSWRADARGRTARNAYGDSRKENSCKKARDFRWAT
jgi:hypothetical protein